MVQLATRTTKRVEHVIILCPLILKGMNTTTNFSILSLGAYDALLEMNWLALYCTKVDFYEKIIECLDETMERRKLQEKINPILVRLITAMHDKRSYQKG